MKRRSRNRKTLYQDLDVIILAAGFGIRIEDNIPKALIKIKNGKTILDYQVKFLSNFIPSDNFSIVVGHKKELVMEQHPELTYIYNEAYTRTNTAKSLLRALRKINNQDVLWINGDVIFDQKLISKLISISKKFNKSCVLVDNKKCGDEEVKYGIDDKGNINAISKELRNARGEALGINIIVNADIPKFIEYLDKTEPKDYFEKAIENMILEENTIFKPVDTGNLFCQEIDFIDDLKVVRAYLKTHKS